MQLQDKSTCEYSFVEAPLYKLRFQIIVTMRPFDTVPVALYYELSWLFLF